MSKEVKLILTAEDNISDVIKKVTDYLGENGLAESITAVSTSFLALKGAAEVVAGAFESVNAIMQEGINSAAEAEMVNKRLAMSMANVGEFTADSYQQINDWSDALEASTGVAAEQTKTLVSLGIQLGLTADQSKLATQAAMDLSVATGVSMDTAFRQLAMTMNGSVGAMGKLVPELAGLTEEQLKNGAALDLVAAKYDGFSKGTADTYLGAQKRIENAEGDVKEAFGRLISQNPAYIAGMNAKADAIKAVADRLDNMTTWALQNGDSIKAMAASVAAATAVVVTYTQWTNLNIAAQVAWNSITTATTTIQKALQVQTVATTSTIQAQQIMEKASASIKAIFNTQTIAQTLAEKQLQASLVAGLVIQKTKQAYETALVGIKALLTAETIKNSAAETFNSAQLAISSAIQKSSAAVSGVLVAVKQALTLENIKNTASTIASTVATGAQSVATGVLAGAIGLATIAQNALNVALTANPIGLAVVAVAALSFAIYKLYQNFDLVTGAIKFGLGKALEYIMIPLGAVLAGVAQMVSVFNADWGAAINKASQNMTNYSKELQKSGQAQMDLARSAKEGGKDMDTAALMASRATEGLTNKIQASAQEMLKLRGAFASAMTDAQAAFDGLKDLTPKMNLELFQRDAKAWATSLENLKKQAGDLQVKIGLAPQDAASKAELEKIQQQVRFAEEATKALKIKTSQEVRAATLKEEEIRIAQVKDKEFSASSEIMMMRIDHAKQTRDQQIAIATAGILASRGLASQAAQEGTTVRQAAMLDANAKELAAYTTQLETQKKLAVDMESQKQLALATMKASALSGDSGAGMAAKNDVEVLQAQQRAAELKVLRDQGAIDQATYEQQLTDMKVNAINNRTQMEVALNNQRIALLGQTPEALQLQLENSRLQTEQEMLALQEKYATQQLTEEEFNNASIARSEEFAARNNEIKEAYLQRDVEKNQRLRDGWGTTLAQIRLEQEKHGQVMGMIQGIQNSQQFKGLQTGLQNASSLMQSENAEQFKIGQAAAIAQAAMQIPLSAIQAYTSMSGIPFVGPALGIAAAAAAVAAGMMNIQKIKSQRPPGSAAHGGIDEIPKSMDNSTFLLKAGERVVQPNMNAELGQAIEKINSGGIGGNSVSVTIQGNADNDVVDRMIDKIVDALREKSERGVPVINSKGIIPG